MILEQDGRVRLTRSEINLLRQNAALNGKAINSVTTLDELLAAVVDGLQPSMAADLLQFLEQRDATPRRNRNRARRPCQKITPTPTPEEAKRETIAARWIIEQEDPDFSPEQRARLEAWLDESEENRRTYRAMERAWHWTWLLQKPK